MNSNDDFDFTRQSRFVNLLTRNYDEEASSFFPVFDFSHLDEYDSACMPGNTFDLNSSIHQPEPSTTHQSSFHQAGLATNCNFIHRFQDVLSTSSFPTHLHHAGLATDCRPAQQGSGQATDCFSSHHLGQLSGANASELISISDDYGTLNEFYQFLDKNNFGAESNPNTQCVTAPGLEHLCFEEPTTPDESMLADNLDDVNNPFQTGGNSSGRFSIVKTRETFDSDFLTSKTYYTIPFNTNRDLDFITITNELIAIFEKFIDFCKKECKGSDKLRMVFLHDDFDVPISIPFMPLDKLDAVLILNMFEKVCQSKRTVKIHNGLKCEVKIMH